MTQVLPLNIKCHDRDFNSVPLVSKAAAVPICLLSAVVFNYSDLYYDKTVCNPGEKIRKYLKNRIYYPSGSFCRVISDSILIESLYISTIKMSPKGEKYERCVIYFLTYQPY